MIIGIDAHNLEGKRTGVGRYLFNLLHEWSKLIPNSQFPIPEIILYFKDEIPGDLLLRLRSGQANFEYKLLKVGSTAKFMNWDLARAAKKDKVDVLFCPDYRAPVFYAGKTAITLHDISYEVHPEWFDWPSAADRILLKWASKFTARKAQAIFVPVNFVKQEVMKHYHISPEKIFVTPEAIDPGLADGAASREHITVFKQKLGLKDNFIFYVGSIFTRRHLPEIITAFSRLAEEKGGWQLLITGKDRTPGRVVDKMARNMNERMGRNAIVRIDFLTDSELKLSYNACAFFIWLSDYEGFGLPVLEAMANGAPVITSDGASLSEVAGPAALLIRNNYDEEEVYRAMKKLAENETFKQELVVKGKEQVEKFSWKECAGKTIETLLNV